MDNDLLELVTSVIMKNESYIQKIEELELKHKHLVNLNEVLVDRLNTLERIVIDIQNSLYKFQSEVNKGYPNDIFNKNYSL